VISLLEGQKREHISNKEVEISTELLNDPLFCFVNTLAVRERKTKRTADCGGSGKNMRILL